MLLLKLYSYKIIDNKKVQNTANIESKLWQQLKTGDIKALDKIYKTYADELFDHGTRLTADSDGVMDAIHDLFLDLYKYRKKLADDVNIKYYLITSLRRKIFKAIKESRKEQSPEEEFYQSQEESVEERIIKSEKDLRLGYQLQSAMGLLTHKQSEIISMRFAENRSYAEIADHNNVSIETVRTSVYRTIKKLRLLLSN